MDNRTLVKGWSLDNRTLIEGPQYHYVALNVSNVAKLVTEDNVDIHIEFPGSSAFNDSRAPLADFFVTYRNGTTTKDGHLGSNFNAMEFLLEWCVQEYTTEVTNGVPITTRTKAKTDFQPNEFGHLFMDEYWVPTSYTLPDYLRKTFNGSIYEDEGSWAVKTSDAAEAFHSKLQKDPLYPGYGPFDPHYGEHEDADVRTAMVQIVQNVATSITNT